eukprot:scaffold125633_cov63-Phaeocystis_antarctica.AAC.5
MRRGVVAGWDAARDAQLAEARAACCEGAERRVRDAGALAEAELDDLGAPAEQRAYARVAHRLAAAERQLA